MGQKTCFRAYLKNSIKVIRVGDGRGESFYPALADLIRQVAQATGRSEIQVAVLPRPLTAESLAVELAKRTRFLRDVVRQQLAGELESGKGHLLGFFEAFQTFLIGSLTPDAFADLCAQTVTYGLFAARVRAADGFSRRAAFRHIPHTIGVLRDLFRFISLEDLPEEMAWVVDDIVEVLAVADVSGMMSRYYREGKGGDPIVYFYETFLAHYDPQERERRGVYYTPDPVVSYIVRSLHILLKTKFGRADGLAAEGVTLLDPAAGTMTFVARAAERAVREFVARYGAGGRETFIRDHILRNFYAFELMVAPYAVGHLKMAFFLEELGHRLEEGERVPFYLTNTLDMDELEASKLPGLSSLAEESRLAGRVKREQPILVILGNPPYSGHSENRGEWILRQIETYKQVDGKPLGEKNSKWLQDDYVKFLRFAQWKIEQAGRGVVGMITNHSYLDNPTFRGMRQSLMQTFDEIYILDLHGNSLKRERCPDGSPDENVFDIRQGVAIAFFVKYQPHPHTPSPHRGPGGGAYHAELWGSRKGKYDWLEGHDVITTPWAEIRPRSEFYLFVPRDGAELERYDAFPKVTEIFLRYSVGIVTARDRLTIRWSEEEVWTALLAFSRLDPELARQVYNLGNGVSRERIKKAQADVADPTRDRVVPILYRPFDVRYTYYTGQADGFHERPRPEVMRHMLAGENVALMTCRQLSQEGWAHALVSTQITDDSMVSNRTRERGYLFPLYLCPDKKRKDLFSALEPQERRCNLNPKLLEALAAAYDPIPTPPRVRGEGSWHTAPRLWEKLKPLAQEMCKNPTTEATSLPPIAPKDVFHYIYAVLYAPSYRERYADFLRLDFPRVPFPQGREIFEAMAALGERLAALHLLQSPQLDPPLARFEGQGDNRVAKSKREGFQYHPRQKRVYINRAQYFAPVPLEVWEYAIGGYQVAMKWLKDRRGRRLTLEEIRTYCRIVTALARTIGLQEEVDGLYSRVEAAHLSLRI